MTITHIRQLIASDKDPANIERLCLRELLMRPATDAEHAELLLMYAEAIATQAEGQADTSAALRAADFALRATKLTGAADVIIKARCLNLRCKAYLLKEDFWTELDEIKATVRQWADSARLEMSQISEVTRRITALEAYGEGIVGQRESRSA